MKKIPFAFLGTVILFAAYTEASGVYDKVEKQGLTWAVAGKSANATLVNCGGTPKTKNGSCNPYTGDTACSAKRPLLCIRRANLPKPKDLKHPQNYSGDSRISASPYTKKFRATSGYVKDEFYSKWSGSYIAATQPVAGNSFKSINEANNFCKKQFDKDWKVAEFHDAGGGWGFFAYVQGKLPKNTRFWVDINDQKQGTCWVR